MRLYFATFVAQYKYCRDLGLGRRHAVKHAEYSARWKRGVE